MIETLYLKTQRGDLPPLRVGVLLDSLAVIRPFAVVLDHLLSADFVRVALLVTHDAQSVLPAPPPPWTALLPRKLGNALRPDVRPHLLYGLYEAFDARRNPAAAKLFEPVDYTAKLAGIDRLHVKPITKRFVHRFEEADLARIREYDLDVVLRFGFNILRGGILQTARYGVWSYHHGDSDAYRGGPPHFWEMVERNPLSGVMLQVLSEELDAGRVLTKALAPSASFTSMALNRLAPYTSGDTFVIRKLWELHSYGIGHLETHSVPAVPYRGRKAIYRRPTNTEMLRFAVPSAVNILRNRLVHSDTVAHWQMAVRRPSRDPFPNNAFDAGGFQWLESPRGHFYADPFAMRRNGVDWIFFEDYDYAARRGTIAVAPLGADGTLGPVETILSKPYHLSYPFLWEQDRELFMIPETGGNKTVELYRCVEFPRQWKLERVLFEGPAVDTTVLSHEGKLWFFVSLMDRPAPPQLFLFSAMSLFDPWKYHPANPISLDVRTARCGGATFSHQGRLIRTAQDGSRCYGYALHFQQVVRLNEQEYVEQQLAAVTPDLLPQSRFHGVHTYNRTEHIELLDAQRRVPTFKDS